MRFLEAIVPEVVPEALRALLTLPPQLLPVSPVPYLAVSVAVWAVGARGARVRALSQ